MQVDSFGKDICGEDDVVVIVLVLIIGIKVFPYGLELIASVFGRYYQYIFAVDAFGQIFNGIDRFREYYKFSFRVTVRLEQFVFEQVVEFAEYILSSIS